ncbi:MULTISPECIES: aminotransferase class I/II-fold pyridoxal phosphate-dependent enzyme [Croceibacter]|uniref:aminotransferase class I/II-fold pyridoxal phosphate-dependent enzyme n=1 Tax=Croceibacter TaxID=216431 RepID=UPI000C50CF25|nr:MULTISPECIES: aminotransferase class I/II-fold pyridoxal phosphate-dependent enzyme [Croceibacter]MBG26197.1 pyridoxal phosphate-dependent aminotransferase [Croceibacter sp.]|tara:strand:+ start:19673 stop:20806 length:1134 start_codon:yes stop_codon:yes gene_type:complete
MNSKIWLSSPHMGGNELSYINEAFDANWIAPLGPNVNNFEESIKTYLGNGVEVAALSSGTAALHLALILLGVSKDDEVICQSFTFAASANPIIYQGATPVFVDSEPDTWNICPKHLKLAIEDRIKKGKKPKAIIAVHLYGMPYKADALNEISKAYNIPIIEDSAEALGSTYKNKNCGTLGDISILSFNGNKIITTSGGGALVSKLPEHKEKAVFLATQARDQAPHYQHTQIGYNYRMSNISAGIGRGQMEVLDDHVNLRRRMNSFYKDLFSSIDDVTVFEEPNSDYYSNHWLSAIIVNETNGKSREGLRVYLETLNIESRPLWKPMHMQPVFSNAPFYGTNVAENLFIYGLCLPSGSNLGEHEISRIKEGILNYFQE